MASTSGWYFACEAGGGAGHKMRGGAQNALEFIPFTVL